MPVYSPLTTSILLDGVDEIVSYGNVVAMTPQRTDPFSWVIWGKSATASNDVLFSSIVSSIGWSMRVGTAVAGDYRMTGPRNNLQPLTVTSVPATPGVPDAADGEWHMFGASSAGNSPLTGLDIEAYLDDVHLTGAQRVQAGSVNTTTVAASTLIAGSTSGSLNTWPGNLLHAAGWNFELTPAQFAEVFGNGQPQDLFDTSFANPVWWDTLGDGDAIGAGNMIDLVAGANGTFINGEAGDFVSDVPAASDTGTAIATQYGRGAPLMRPTTAQVKAFGDGGFRRSNDA